MDKKFLVSSFFSFINDKNHKYAILHHLNEVFNYDKDIDFVIDCKTKKEFFKLIRDFTITIDHLYVFNKYTIDRKNYRVDLVYYKEGELIVIELDACIINNNEKDLLSVNTSKLLRNRYLVVKEGINFYRVSLEDEIEYYIKKKAFKRQHIDFYFDYFNGLGLDINILSLQNLYEKKRKYFDSFFFKIKFYYNKCWLIMDRLNKPLMHSVVFLGPDGSGKSTLIKLLRKSKLPFRDIKYFHLKPLKKLSGNFNVKNPHGRPEYGVFKSFIKILFFILQYNIGWLKNIFPLKFKSCLIIFDRYYDDIFVDKKRYRYGGGNKLLKLARNFIPKPDTYFVLTGSTELIYNRKKEITFFELEKLIESYEDLAKRSNYYTINVDKSPDIIMGDVIVYIIIAMSKKQTY